MPSPDTVDPLSFAWYHTIELPTGVITPGEYDHRSITDKVGLPERLDGQRCLDVGTHDGYWAFEMERRGAREVIALDVASPEDLDWPEPRPTLTPELRSFLETRKQAFHCAAAALGSKVQSRYESVYDLDAEAVGRFDVAFIGSLLHHLRDPIGALQAVRRVVDGQLVLVAVFSPWKTAILPFTPVTELADIGNLPFWQIPNIAGLRRQLEMGGWTIERWGRPHFQPYGAGWRMPPLAWRSGTWRTLPRQLLLRRGALHISVAARRA